MGAVHNPGWRRAWSCIGDNLRARDSLYMICGGGGNKKYMRSRRESNSRSSACKADVITNYTTRPIRVSAPRIERGSSLPQSEVLTIRLCRPTPTGIRTQSLPLRRRAPYPLGHGRFLNKSRKQVSILRPRGYEPRALPLRHPALLTLVFLVGRMQIHKMII